VDDVGIRLVAEAADHQDRDTRVGEPAGQLLAKGVLLPRDVQGVLLALGAVKAEPVLGSLGAAGPAHLVVPVTASPGPQKPAGSTRAPKYAQARCTSGRSGWFWACVSALSHVRSYHPGEIVFADP
jgi:hypothetical protein